MAYVNGNGGGSSGASVETGEFPFEWYPDPSEPTDTILTSETVKWSKASGIVTMAFPAFQAINNYGANASQYILIPAELALTGDPATGGKLRPLPSLDTGGQSITLNIFLDASDSYLDVKGPNNGAAWDSTINCHSFVIQYKLEW